MSGRIYVSNCVWAGKGWSELGRGLISGDSALLCIKGLGLGIHRKRKRLV